ncbi:MAG: pyruvate, water dikinase regulatory protein [Alphaproteobacteria bacterium]
MPKGPKKFYLHLVSDASGTTLLGISRAILSQFSGIKPSQKFWPLIRSDRQLERVLRKISEKPGPVIFTLVREDMRIRLMNHCNALEIPCMPVLEPIIQRFSSYLGLPAAGVPGLQYALDDEYFRRVAAMDFAMRNDDGRTYDELKKADVILVGISRTSKTPTSMFLARSGILTANLPLVPGIGVAEKYLRLKKPLYVGLTAHPSHLRALRYNRIKSGDGNVAALIDSNDYIDENKIEEEVRSARRLFTEHGWPIIDVTKRSIEETSAEIFSIMQMREEQRKQERKQTGKNHDQNT